MVILSFLYIGNQIVLAYSGLGLTTDLYRFKNISLSIYVKVRKINPTFLLARLTLLLMCTLNFSNVSMKTPKCFFSSHFLCGYWVLISFHFVFIVYIMISDM